MNFIPSNKKPGQRHFSTSIKRPKGIKNAKISNQELSDDKALDMFKSKEKNELDPDFKKYTKQMQYLLTEIKGELSQSKGKYSVNKLKSKTAQGHQIIDARIKANEASDRNNYFKSKALGDSSPLHRFVDPKIKDEYENKLEFKQALDLQAYMDDYDVDNMNEEEYKEYLQKWADPKLLKHRETIYQLDAQTSRPLIKRISELRKAAARYEED